MPLVRISFQEGRVAETKRAISEAVHQAMVDTINVPADDRFQIIDELKKGDLVYDRGYLGIKRSEDIVVVQITLNAGRTIDMKKALYARIAALLKEKAGVQPEDIVINLVEVPKENWSFGNGIAQYAPKD